ncbi:MAG: phage tail protein [Chloroflexi bacterium]|nr:phage tail protein [Chloroflexota bacterium]
MNVVLQDNTARAVADIMLHEAWIRRTGYVVRLPYRWYQVAPGDVLSLPSVAGETRLMKVTQVTAGLPGELVCTGVAYDPDVYTQSVTGAGLSSGGTSIVVCGGTVYVLADLPALRAQDSAAPGFYAGACSDGTGIWNGAALYSNTGAGYNQIATFPNQATIGVTTTGLPTGPTNDFDRSSSVTVVLSHGTLSSQSEQALRNNPATNACMIGGELLQFASAVLQAGTTWVLSDLRRGLKGTPTTGHTSGEDFMLLNNAVVRVNVDPAEVGQSITYKGATNCQDIGSVTATKTFTTQGNSLLKLPTAPTGLTATGSVASVVLSWSSVAQASSYNVLRTTTSGGPYSLVGTTTGPSYTDTDLTNGTTYYYVVQAYNSVGMSPYSAQASATPGTAAPTGVTATPANGVVYLNWNAAAGVPGYNVLRATVSGGPYTTITNVTGTSWTDTGLTNGTTYYYVIQSVSGANTANSAQVSATPAVPSVAPGAPTATATAGDMQVWINITPVSGATSYNIYRSTTSATAGFTQLGSVSGYSNYLDTGLTNGMTYWYYAVAVNSVGNSAAGPVVSGVPGSVVGEPAAPTGFAGSSPSAGQVQLAWNAVSGAVSYSVYRATVNGTGYILVMSNITASSYLDQNLTPSTTYYYIVEAVNGAGAHSVKSAQVTVTPEPVPAAPTNLSATSGNASVSLSWTGSQYAASYQVSRGATTGGPYSVVSTGITGTSYTDNSVVNGTTYYYVVQAVNPNGTSPNSNEVQVSPAPVPTAPTNLVATVATRAARSPTRA